MFRNGIVTVLLLLAVVSLVLSGCNLIRRDAPPVPGPRPQAPTSAAVTEVKPPPREDFRNYEPKPIPSGAEAKTGADFAPIRMKWARRISIDLYREMGMRDPRWDEQAEALLEAYAKHEGCQGDKPTVAEYARLADALVATECPDPLVRLAAGSAYFLAKRYEDAETNVFWESPPGAPDYPDIAMLPRHAVGWQIHCQVNPDNTQFVDGSYSVFKSNMETGLRDTQLTGDEPWAVFHWLEHKLDDM